MSKYTYRHHFVSDDPNLSDSTSDTARILRAAFKIANDAHKKDSRKKMDPSIQYISHPLMVYDLLCRMGETDPILLAAALLHDALEVKKIRAQPEKIQQALQTILVQQGFAGAKAQDVSDKIYQLVLEVTNPEVLPEGKEVEQVVRAESMSFAAKKLKIADQTASLLCNLTMANDPEKFSFDQEKEFMLKAWGLVAAIVRSEQDHPEQIDAMKAWGSLFGRVMLQVSGLLATSSVQQKHLIRQLFDFDRIMDSTTEINILPDTHDIYFHCYPGKILGQRFRDASDESAEDQKHPDIPLLRVDFDVDGKVVGYLLQSTWDDDHSAFAGIRVKMTNTIREKRRLEDRWIQKPLPQRALLEIGEEHVIYDPCKGITRSARAYRLSPPMHINAFAAAAIDADACTRAIGHELRLIPNQMLATERNC